MRLRWLSLLLLSLVSAIVSAQPEGPVEIMVTGRQPGPPLWRVNNGDNVLWIFPTLSPVPEGMIWESDKVAEVLAQSQELLEMPDIDVDVSKLMLLNPINLFRGMRLAKRLSRNPEGASLQEVLPPDLYARYAALKERYFPREKDFDELRPLAAGGRMTGRVQRAEGLVSGEEIGKQLQRLIRRNRNLVRTPIEVTMNLKGSSYKSLATRAETMVNSMSSEQELVCFAEQLRRLERDIGEMKIRANAWAQGYVDEFRGIPLPGDDDDACMQLVLGSSEFGTITQLQDALKSRWLEAAEQALARNASTFAILPIGDLLRDNGAMAQLRARGYEVREP